MLSKFSRRREQSSPAARLLVVLGVLHAVAGCVSALPVADAPGDLSVAWVRNSAEYRALAQQVYTSAGLALPALLADPSWSALPGQGTSALPPAIVLDIDETVLDNSVFQIELAGRRFDPALWDRWVASRRADAVPGAVEFLAQARAAGVTPFYVTNRACARRAEALDPCPQHADTLANLLAVGVPAAPEQLLLKDQRDEWTGEKLTRREYVARGHRVLMLFGDDLGDFLPCVRGRIVAPCTAAATTASRARGVDEHRRFWGNGWYVLPNPMYGSWADLE